MKLNKDYINEKKLDVTRKFLYSNCPKYVIGTNNYALKIAQNIKINGFVDEFTKMDNFFNFPVIHSLEEIPDNAIVVSTVIGKPISMEKKSLKYQFDYVDYFSFYKYSDLKIPNVMFWNGVKKDIEKNFIKYKKIYKLLKDKISKNQFFNIINFRYSYDIDYIRGFANIEDKQYFEKFLNLESEIFVDIGGYTGDTVLRYIEHDKNYKKIYFFEPIKYNFIKAKKNLKNFENIIFFNIGLSDKKSILKMTFNGSSSKICDNGDYTIKVDTLDNVIDKKITFIKMDVEGEELAILRGAKNLIKKHHPKMAICVYHKPEHFWQIPEFILSIREDYEVYFRHYTEGISESVMYFVPRRDK